MTDRIDQIHGKLQNMFFMNLEFTSTGSLAVLEGFRGAFFGVLPLLKEQTDENIQLISHIFSFHAKVVTILKSIQHPETSYNFSTIKTETNLLFPNETEISYQKGKGQSNRNVGANAVSYPCRYLSFHSTNLHQNDRKYLRTCFQSLT